MWRHFQNLLIAFDKLVRLPTRDFSAAITETYGVTKKCPFHKKKIKKVVPAS